MLKCSNAQMLKCSGAHGTAAYTKVIANYHCLAFSPMKINSHLGLRATEIKTYLSRAMRHRFFIWRCIAIKKSDIGLSI
jgi:hypothetical protein